MLMFWPDSCWRSDFFDAYIPKNDSKGKYIYTSYSSEALENLNT